MKKMCFGGILLALLATGCFEPSTEYAYVLYNGCDSSEIRIQATEGPDGAIDARIVAGEGVVLSAFVEEGADPVPSAIGRYFEQILITRVVVGDTCRKDPNLDATWSVKQEVRGNRSRRYSYDFTMGVTDDDF
jgi:hypothetical protein